MSARRALSWAGAVALTGIAFAAGSIALSTPAAAGPAARPAEQEFFWEWSDGVSSRTRTFSKAAYKTPGNLPKLVVSADPAQPQQYAKLQFKQRGSWVREDGAATNSSGNAHLSLNPICDDGKWCEGTYKYRAIINGNFTTFTITYSLG